MFLRLQRALESLENAGSASWYYGFFATASPLCTAAASVANSNTSVITAVFWTKNTTTVILYNVQNNIFNTL